MFDQLLRYTFFLEKMGNTINIANRNNLLFQVHNTN